jgi:hypothetical protein
LRKLSSLPDPGANPMVAVTVLLGAHCDRATAGHSNSANNIVFILILKKLE